MESGGAICRDLRAIQVFQGSKLCMEVPGVRAVVQTPIAWNNRKSEIGVRRRNPVQGVRARRLEGEKMKARLQGTANRRRDHGAIRETGEGRQRLPDAACKSSTRGLKDLAGHGTVTITTILAVSGRTAGHAALERCPTGWHDVVSGARPGRLLVSSSPA